VKLALMNLRFRRLCRGRLRRRWTLNIYQSNPHQSEQNPATTPGQPKRL
jgi:hypothetical protein